MAHDFDLPADQPSSPTLTNPDMILPESNGFKSVRYSAMVAPSDFDLEILRSVDAHIARGPQSPSILIRPSSPHLDMDDDAHKATPTQAFFDSSVALPSSPTLQDSAVVGQNQLPGAWRASVSSRRFSGASSILSEETESVKWPARDGTDSSITFEDDEEEEAKFGYFPKTSSSDDGFETDAWLGTKEDSLDNPYSPAALSRRADLILANAKKRLTLMEGNLRGARHSLPPKSPSYLPPLSNGRSASQLTSYPRQSFEVPSGNNSDPGHSRLTSDMALPSPAPTLPAPRPPILPMRSSSALGSFAGFDSLVRSGSLRGARSQEAMRENRLQSWILDDNQSLRSPLSPLNGTRSASSLARYPSNRSSSPAGDNPKRPNSNTSEIRAQMNELKGRISELRERAKEDHAKRASLLSVRSTTPPSPREMLYSEVENYTARATWTGSSGAGPTSIPSNVFGAQKRASWMSGYGGMRDDTAQDDLTEYEESHYEDAEETLDDLEEELGGDVTGASRLARKTSTGQSRYSATGASRSSSSSPILGREDPNDRFPEADGPFRENGVDGLGDSDDQSVSEQSEYFEAESLTSSERHEDRADAFDYEHFFLHSAMGSYSRDRRNGSFSSEDSVETTRPISPRRTATATTASAVHTSDSDPWTSSLRRRRESSDSVSTLDTFQTAVEGDEEETPENSFGVDTAREASAGESPVADGEDLGRQLQPNGHGGAGDAGDDGDDGRVWSTSSSVSSTTKHTDSSIRAFVTTLFPPGHEKDRPLAEEVLRLLQRCCLEMQRRPEGSRERDAWRERIQRAKRALGPA